MRIFEILTKLREKYPDDVDQIDKETERVKELVKRKEFQNNETTKELIALCKKEILQARKKIATSKEMIDKPDLLRKQWEIIDSRLWVIDFICGDYEEVLINIENELKVELDSL